jgi:hypothetical protein
MNRTELTQFSKLWAGMAEMYGKSVSDAVIAMAYAALEKYDLADIRRAINAHVADPSRGQFLAKPADLILHIDGDPESRSLQAWTKVENAIKRVGPHQDVVFDDASVMAAIEDMGGWILLCGINDQELPFKRQEFAKRYKGYLARPPAQHPARLIGISSASNMQRFPNYKADPVLIGNPQQALLVHDSGGARKDSVMTLSSMLNKLALPGSAA